MKNLFQKILNSTTFSPQIYTYASKNNIDIGIVITNSDLSPFYKQLNHKYTNTAEYIVSLERIYVTIQSPDPIIYICTNSVKLTLSITSIQAPRKLK